MNIAWICALGVGGATVLGAIAGFLIRKVDGKAFALAAGIMLGAALFGLIIPAMDTGRILSIIPGMFIGALALNCTDHFLYRNKRTSVTTHGLLFVAAIAIHNFPEGIAAGVGFGTGDLSNGILISGGIALQNLPEGMIIIAPMLMAGYSPIKTLLIAMLTGLVEVVGTMLGFYAMASVTSLLPFALSFAGGTMLYVICTEMLPDAKHAPYWVLSGFSVMLIFSMLL